MFDGTEDWWNLKEYRLVLSKVTWKRWRNSDFNLENKMAEQIKLIIQNNQIDQMQRENFILPWK